MMAAKLKALAAAKAKVALLERSIAEERDSELAALPGRYNFKSVAAFVAAIRTASKKQRRAQGRSEARAGRPDRRKRATITDSVRARVKKLVTAGKTAPEIASAVGISKPSVAKIKKVLGLTKRHG